MAAPYLRDRLVLKGGTALNLFCAEDLPRLSVDLDFNYIGSIDKEIMKQEKIELERIILDLCHRRRYTLHRNPRAHAEGWILYVYWPFIFLSKKNCLCCAFYRTEEQSIVRT